MATSDEDLHRTADVVSDHLSHETRHGDDYRVTTVELASTLSLPVRDVGEVMESLSGDPEVPVSKDGDGWVVTP